MKMPMLVTQLRTLIGCSVRDLIRKKQCYRVEPHESGSLGVKKLLLIGEQKEEISLSPKQLGFKSFQDHEQEKWPLGPLLKEEYGNERRISTGRVHAITEKKLVGTDITNDTTAQQIEKFIGQEQGQDSGVCSFGCPGSTSFNVEGKPVDLIAITFCRKPPTQDSKDGQFENASCSPTLPDHSYLVDEENHEGTSGRALDNILSYFVRDCPEEKEFRSKWQKNSNRKSHQEDIMGVPSQYLNDVSCLYMLTPAFSPPSVDCVNRWLLYDEGVGDVNKSPVEPSSPKGSCDDLICSQGLLHDYCNKPLAESGSNVMPVSEELHPETDGMVNIELSSDSKEVTTMLQSEGCVAEQNACTDCLQDILTLLSIEVQAESRGDLRHNPQYDAINVVALAFQNDDGSAFEVYVLLRSNFESFQRSLDGVPDCKVFVFPDEKYLFSHFIKILLSFDPNILMGSDIQGGSLGFLAARAARLGIGLLNDISRTTSETKIAAAHVETFNWGIPEWFASGPGRARYRCIEYVVGRAKLNLEIMNQLDMVV